MKPSAPTGSHPGSQRAPLRRNDILDRLARNIRPLPNGCWNWNGHDIERQAVNAGGWTGESIRAYRLVWEATRAPLAPGFALESRCGYPGCVNPQHRRLVVR